MVMHLKQFVLLISIFGASIAMATDKNCVDCGMKDVQGLANNKSLSQLERIAKSAEEEGIYPQASQNDYIEKYCLKFNQTPKELVGSLIKEFEKTPFPVDEYFLHNKCQMEGYSTAVKSPMIHSIAETPESRADFLNSIWLYYSKKRKQPEIFKQIINAKNTRGETILDYIESLRLRGRNNHPGLVEPVNNLIAYICSHGGVYTFHKNKSCTK